MKTCRLLYGLFTLFCVLFCIGNALAQETAAAGTPEIILLGGDDFDFDQALLDQKHSLVNSVSNDLKLTLKDVHFTDGLMSFTLEMRTSESAVGNVSSSNSFFLNGQTMAAGGGAGIEPGPDVHTETYAWYDVPSVYGMDWESFRITFEDVFFTSGDGAQAVYIAPAKDYSWSFVFHNSENSSYNADNLAAVVDERGIHTFGDSFDIDLGGFLISSGPAGESDPVFSFNLVTKSDLLNAYGSQDSMWYNGENLAGGGNSIEFDENGDPVLPADRKFTNSDHFVYQVPQKFSAAENNLAVWAKNAVFEITCTGPSVDPVMGYTWKWESGFADREGNSLYPAKLAQFNHVTERLPQPEDPVLLSETVDGISVDIVGLDFVKVPNSRLYGIQTDTGETVYFQVGLCFTAADDGEWNVLPEQLMVGETEIWPRFFGRGGMVLPTAEAPGKICGQVRYDITDQDPDWSLPLTFSIRELFAIPREGSPCRDILHRYDTNSAAQALGVTLSCQDAVADDSVRGPQDYMLTVESFDGTKWTQEEAAAEIERLLNDRISGPWVFRIPDISKFIEDNSSIEP